MHTNTASQFFKANNDCYFCKSIFENGICENSYENNPTWIRKVLIFDDAHTSLGKN